MSARPGLLTGKTALVTGGSRGLGRAIAQAFAEAGADVVVASRKQDAVRRTAAEIGEATGRRVIGVAAHVGDWTQCGELIETTIGTMGRLDVLVNNAGIGSRLVAFEELGAAELAAMLALNAGGTFIVAQECARRMKDGGSIINIASRGYLGGAGASHYVASKAAVVGLTRAMAIELRWQGIRVNAVAPGMVDTRMISDFTPDTRRSLLSREPSGRPAEPREIAEAVAFLASDQARFVSGQVLLVDGGKSLGMPLL